MTLQIEPKTTTRRDLLMIAGAAATTGGLAKVLGTDAFAQTIAGKIKAVDLMPLRSSARSRSTR
jgi:hypothetical protein